MDKKLFRLKIITPAIAVFLFAFSRVCALEVSYPSLPETFSPANIAEYLRYIYIFAIFATGTLVLINFIWAGIKFLYSGANPSERTDARNKLTATLLGAVIIIASFLILSTINSNLTNFFIPSLQNFPKTNPDNPPAHDFEKGDLFKRLMKISEEIKYLLQDYVEKTSKNIYDITEKCKCSNATSICYCQGETGPFECKPQKCYVKTGSDICDKENDGSDKDKPGTRQEITSDQNKITYFRNLLLYYQGRIGKEIEDLDINIKSITNPGTGKIAWYNNSIKDAQDNVQKTKGSAEEKTWQSILDQLKNGLQKAREELQIKNTIKEKLARLQDLVSQLPSPLIVLSNLPEQCFADIDKKCQAKCKDNKEEGYGCFNSPLGCQPDDCTGENTCPRNEMKTVLDKIKDISGQCTGALNNLAQTINSLPQ